MTPAKIAGSLKRAVTVRWAVDSVNQKSDDAAVVTIRKTIFYNDGLLGSHEESQTFTMQMTSEEGKWKVGQADLYWSNCWGTSQEFWCR